MHKRLQRPLNSGTLARSHSQSTHTCGQQATGFRPRNISTLHGGCLHGYHKLVVRRTLSSIRVCSDKRGRHANSYNASGSVKASYISVQYVTGILISAAYGKKTLRLPHAVRVWARAEYETRDEEWMANKNQGWGKKERDGGELWGQKHGYVFFPNWVNDRDLFLSVYPSIQWNDGHLLEAVYPHPGQAQIMEEKTVRNCPQAI